MKRLAISDIRLGWLERFCSVARHRNIVKASQECNVDPTSVSDSIQKLEDALCRPLMAPATAYVPAFGRRFVHDAERILRISVISPHPLTNVSISWFYALVAISESNSYVEAGDSLGWKRYKVMRGVSELESWVGSQLVFSRTAIRLTLKGEEVLPAAREIISILEGLRGSPEIWYGGRRRPRKVPWWLRTFGPAEFSNRRGKR